MRRYVLTDRLSVRNACFITAPETFYIVLRFATLNLVEPLAPCGRIMYPVDSRVNATVFLRTVLYITPCVTAEDSAIGQRYLSYATYFNCSIHGFPKKVVHRQFLTDFQNSFTAGKRSRFTTQLV